MLDIKLTCGRYVNLDCRVWGLGFGVWGLGFGVWGLGFGGVIHMK